MSSILIAANRVPIDPASVHLQLVYNNSELEVQAGFTWQFRARPHDGFDQNGEPNTPHLGESDWYDSIAIDIGNRS